MLVLTTMFINVSNNLPKTSYVKMIDIWLIFNLLLPFIEVLIHSYMDTLRYNSQVGSSLQVATFYTRDDDDREINHHGCTIEVGEAEAAEKVKMGYGSNLKFYQVSDKDLVAVDEKVQLGALKSFYER